MALNWKDIPTTNGGSTGNLQTNARYNMKFRDIDYKILTPKNSGVKSGSLVIFKLAVTNGDGVGTYVQLMVNLDPADEKWLATQQNAILKVIDAAELNREDLPEETTAVMQYLIDNLKGKEISATVTEGGVYNGKPQWEIKPWDMEKKSTVPFKVHKKDTLVTSEDTTPDDWDIDA